MMSALDFDEGYFLQVAWNLWHNRTYASFYQLFDPYITTGPTVLLPASLFVPFHPLAPRAVTVLYVAALAYVAYRYYFSSLLRLAAWILITALLPHSHLYLTHVLGEMPGLFFIMAGYGAVADKRILLGALLLGHATLTKQIYLLALFPLILTRQWKTLCIAPIPLLLWQSIVFLFGSGNTLEITRALSWPRPDMLWQRATMIEAELLIPFWLFCIVLYTFWAYGASRQGPLRLLSMFCWVYGTYYLLLYSNYSYRTLFPLLVSTLVIGVSLLPRRLIVAVLIIGCIIFFMIFHYPQETEIVSYDQQKELGDFAHSLEGVISSCGWFSAPEISYLAGRRIERRVTSITKWYIATKGVIGCKYPSFPAKELFCNAQHCVYQKL